MYIRDRQRRFCRSSRFTHKQQQHIRINPIVCVFVCVCKAHITCYRRTIFTITLSVIYVMHSLVGFFSRRRFLCDSPRKYSQADERSFQKYILCTGPITCSQPLLFRLICSALFCCSRSRIALYLDRDLTDRAIKGHKLLVIYTVKTDGSYSFTILLVTP